MYGRLRTNGNPYAFEVWVNLLVKGWTAGQATRVANQLDRIKGWKGGGIEPDRILCFYDASKVREDDVRRHASAILTNVGVAQPMLAVYTRWRMDYRLKLSPPEQTRLVLMRALRSLRRGTDAFFDHDKFRTVSILVEDEPSEQMLRRIRRSLAAYL